MKIGTSFLFLLALLSGCATHSAFSSNDITGTITATSSEIQPEENSFIIFSDKGVGKKLAENFSYHRKYLQGVMTRNGYFPAEAERPPAIAVHLSYSTSEPLVMPETHVVSSREATGAITPSYINGIITYQPEYVWKSRIETREVTSYRVTMTLTGHEVSGNNEISSGKEIWKTTATYQGPLNDMNYLLPYLMEVAGAYIGKTTPAIQSFQIEKNDPRVIAARASLSKP